tara:strand:- start:1925 stop:2464 length:540 start_codon:yes stop_codon:yes gene_type:complete
MRIAKSKMYCKEQREIRNRVIDILNLDGLGFYLYSVDNDKWQQKQIMDLVPQIWKYFSHINITGLQYPEKCKRPWLSIARGVLKSKYRLKYKACRFWVKKLCKSVYTLKYYMEPIQDPRMTSSISDLNEMKNEIIKSQTMMVNSLSMDNLSGMISDENSENDNYEKKVLRLRRKKSFNF